MNKKELSYVKKYLKFICSDDIKTKKSIEIYASSLSEEKLNLIVYYVKNGVLKIPKSSLLDKINNRLNNKTTEEREILFKLRREARKQRMFNLIDDKKFLYELKKYEKELRKVPEQNLIKFFQKLGYYSICNDDEKFQEFINGLTINQFKNILETINTKLNRLNLFEKKKRRKDMRKVGSHYDPIWFGATDVVIDNTLTKLLDAVKKMNNRKHQAMIAFYTLLLLHMFEDGNGRTSRLIYDLIDGTHELQDNFDWYFHSLEDQRTYSGSFEDQRNIMSIYNITSYLYNHTKDVLEKYRIDLPQDFYYKIVQNNVLQQFPMLETINDIPIKNEIYEQLTEEQVHMINHLLKDNIKSDRYEVGGLIMLIITYKKNELNKWLERNDNSDVLTFNFNKDSDLFSSWTLEDYLNVIKIGNDVKQEMFNRLIDTFFYKEKYNYFDLDFKENIISPTTKQRS